MEKTMTAREYYQNVLYMIDGTDDHEVDVFAVRDKTTELLQALDAKNEKRKTTDTKEKKEAAARRQKVLDYLRSEPCNVFTREEIADAVNIKPTEVTGACNVLVKGGQVAKNSTKVEGTRKTVYTIVQGDEPPQYLDREITV